MRALAPMARILRMLLTHVHRLHGNPRTGKPASGHVKIHKLLGDTP